MRVKELTDALLYIEDELDLLNQTISGVFFWERMRSPVQRCVFQAAGLLEAAHPRGKSRFADASRLLLHTLQNVLHKNPLFSPQSEILFVGSARRRLQEDGKWWDIYCDPVIEALKRSYVLIEFPYLFAHRKPAKTESLRYLDFLYGSSAIQRAVLVDSVFLKRSEKQLLQRIQMQIMAQCGVGVDLENMVKRDLILRRSRFPYYSRILQKVEPKLVVLVCSYGKETFIEACQSSGVPVIELQHGMISQGELSYSYPGPAKTKRTFPDYLFTFGDFWKESVEFPISKQQIASVGYPFLEQEAQKHVAAVKKDQLLFVSQKPIGKKLSRFAVELSCTKKLPWSIVYKLHPAECDHWQKLYPWLARSGIQVIDSDVPSLYRLFAESKAQIGVSSAAIFEGLFFGLKTYLLRLPTVEYMRHLVDNGYATVVDSADDYLTESLSQNPHGYDVEYFFKPGALENMKAAVDRILTS